MDKKQTQRAAKELQDMLRGKSPQQNGSYYDMILRKEQEQKEYVTHQYDMMSTSFPPKPPTPKATTSYDDTVQARAAQLRRFLQESHDVLQMFYEESTRDEGADTCDTDGSIFGELNTAMDLSMRLVERLRKLYAEVGVLKFGEVE